MRSNDGEGKLNKDHYRTDMPGGYLVYRGMEEGEILEANDYVVKLLGCKDFKEFLSYTKDSFLGMILPEDAKETKAEIMGQLEFSGGDDTYVCFRAKAKDGGILFIESYGHLVLEAQEVFFYVFLIDTARKKIHDDIDSITGLVGRNRFIDQVSRVRDLNWMAGNFDQYLLYVNITDFKHFNVEYGSEKGDEALVKIGQFLKGYFPNQFISRFYADHFMVYTDQVDLEDFADRFFQEVTSWKVGGNFLPKVGCYKIQGKDEIRDACEFAKMAGDYIKKDVSRISCLYTRELGEKLKRKEYIITHLGQALEQHYLQAYYQPVIRTFSGKLCSLEALCRWIDPVLGMISPGEFVPYLEEKNLLFQLDRYMVEEVCKQLRTQLDLGNEVVPVSMNISTNDFIEGDPFSIIDQTVKEYGLNSKLICIEITESAAITDQSLIQEAMEHFHEAGYEVWMDDYGSGYSSLNVLKNFEFDEIKIDMAFIRDSSERAKKILESTLNMAKNIGICTLVEGAENQDQINFLTSIGCEKIQGYYYGKPMPYEPLMEEIRRKGIRLEKRLKSQLDSPG